MMRRAVLALLLAVTAACTPAEIYTRQTERQANEMVSVLRESGIDAGKTEVKDAGWTVTAPAGDFSRAVRILSARGYPRDQFDSLGSVFRKDGFASSPVEERARFIFALSQELSHTISAIDGVVQARVQLALPEADALTGDRAPPSASVFIRHRPDVDFGARTSSIKALVVTAVEGLSYDRVTVELFVAQPLSEAEAPATGANRILLAWVGAGALLAMAIAAALLWASGRLALPGLGRRAA